MSDPTLNLAERLAGIADPAGLLHEIFLRAPMGLQIYERSGRCLLVNPAHTALFGGVPPPEYNLFADNLLAERGIADLVRRAFAGEHVSVPAHWYDIRELRNLPSDADVSGGRRIAIAAELLPLRDARGDISHVLIVFDDQTETREAREHAEAAAGAAEQRATQATFLADAGRLLSSSLDLDVTLAQVARLATATLADFCIIDLVGEDDAIRRVAVVHRDPLSQQLLDELRLRFPPDRSSPQPAARVIASGQPELLAEVDPEIVAAHTRSAEHRDLITRLSIRSHLAVPLRVGDRTVGAISLGHTGDRRYSVADVPLAEALASHAAIAIDNARLFRAAEDARREAEAANRAKDEFLAMLGHELRNPLAPIVTALELTRARDGDSRERAMIERQVLHLRRLVDDLLDVSRITRGALPLEQVYLELAGAIDDGIHFARPLVDERKHTLAVDVEPGLVVHGDRVRLAQIVSNLVINAARYTEPGGQIWVSAAREDGRVVLRVRDTGVGISEELAPHVFDAFTRGGRAIERASSGLGLGLAIVKSLAALHGGTAAVTSGGAGRGAELVVTLPAADRPAEVTAPARVPAPAAPPARDKVVLVVDDNRDAGELLASALELEGYDVLLAHDPKVALKLAAAKPPALALLDLGLPGMDGYELARRLRSEHAGVTLVALTGFGQEADRERTRLAGFADHLVKPTPLDVLLPVVERVLSR